MFGVSSFYRKLLEQSERDSYGRGFPHDNQGFTSFGVARWQDVPPAVDTVPTITPVVTTAPDPSPPVEEKVPVPKPEDTTTKVEDLKTAEDEPPSTKKETKKSTIDFDATVTPLREVITPTTDGKRSAISSPKSETKKKDDGFKTPPPAKKKEEAPKSPPRPAKKETPKEESPSEVKDVVFDEPLQKIFDSSSAKKGSEFKGGSKGYVVVTDSGHIKDVFGTKGDFSKKYPDIAKASGFGDLDTYGELKTINGQKIMLITSKTFTSLRNYIDKNVPVEEDPPAYQTPKKTTQQQKSKTDPQTTKAKGKK